MDAKEHIENAKERILQIDDTSYVSYYFDNELKSIDELYDKSDFVVVVKPDGKRVNFSQSILTDVKVIKVLKEPDFKIKDYIKIYEPCNFVHEDYYASLGFYNIMQEGKEYILFLEKLRRADDYKGKENHTEFKPVSTIYSKYDVSGEETVVLIDETELEKEKITYEDIRDRALLPTDKSVIEPYEKFRQGILKKYT